MRFKTSEIGTKGEDYAVRYLKKHRCKILERNYRKPFGEIDIIARKRETYLFVEVKTRHDTPLARPYEAVDFRKQERLVRTAKAYISENQLDGFFRFDVCEVYVDRDTLKQLRIEYYENAFAPENDSIIL